MKKIFATSIFSFMAVILLLSVINTGCSSRRLDQNQQNILEQPQENTPEQRQKTATSAKPKETSIFSVIEIEDVEYPTHSVSIHLPYRARPNNTVCLTEKHAYLTTERHLHVIDISIPQRPSYLTSLPFDTVIGKARIAGHYVVISGKKELYLVNIEHPMSPVLGSTAHLPDQNTIKDFDVRESHLYVLGANDTLYVFSIDFGQARLVKSIELERRWWLLSLKPGSPAVKQSRFPTSETLDIEIGDPLRSERQYLQIRSSKQEKVRASSVFLVMEWRIDPTYDLFSYDSYRSFDRPFGTTLITGYHNLALDFRKYLTETGQKTLTRSTPARAYAVASGKMQEIHPEPSSETMDVEAKRLKQLIGPVTDFQVSGYQLYIVTANGFFFIRPVIHKYLLLYFYNSEESAKPHWIEKNEGFLPFLAGRPISLAVDEGGHYAYVLSDPEASER
jgi:hypothetical protein